MTVEGQERRILQEALVDTLGPDPADTLMRYLPPVGWADVATKHDLDVLGESVGLRLTAMQAEFNAKIDTGLAGVRTEFHAGLTDVYRALNQQTWKLVGAFTALQALLIAALKVL